MDYNKADELRDYEAMFLFSTQEEQFRNSLSEIKELLASVQANIESEEDMGVKRLAYEVQKKKDGRYYLFKLKMDGKKLEHIYKELSVREDILRYMFIKIEKKYYPVKKNKGGR